MNDAQGICNKNKSMNTLQTYAKVFFTLVNYPQKLKLNNMLFLSTAETRKCPCTELQLRIGRFKVLLRVHILSFSVELCEIKILWLLKSLMIPYKKLSYVFHSLYCIFSISKLSTICTKFESFHTE